LHVMDDKQRIALVETRTQGSEPGVPAQLMRYQLSNHLGSASLELDDAGQIISYEEYYPYGTTSYQAGRSAAEVSLKRYRYTGMERDEENGLSYHSARYYAPWLGRWVSCDPSGLKDGVDLYIYVGSNPIGFIDPTGNEERRQSIAQIQRGLEEIKSEIAATKAKLAHYEEVEAKAKAELKAVQAAQMEIQKKLEAARAEVIKQKQLAADWAAQAKKHEEDAQRHAKNARIASGAAKFFGAVALAFSGCGAGIGCLIVASGAAGAGASQVISAEETRNPIEEGASKGLQFAGVDKETANLITQSAENGYFMAVSVYSIRYGNSTYTTPPPRTFAPRVAEEALVARLPKGATVISKDPAGNWVKFRTATGEVKIQFDAKQANAAGHGPSPPSIPGRRPTPETYAEVDANGKVIVFEGMHRHQAAKNGTIIPPEEGGVPGRPSWLEYDSSP